jgi:hypothetical protein
MLFTGLTAIGTAAGAWAVLYPYYRNRMGPQIAYGFDVDLRGKHVPAYPWGIEIESPEVRRFVLRIVNPRLEPITVAQIYFQAKVSDRGARDIISYKPFKIQAGDSAYVYRKMEPNIVTERSRVFLVIEGIGWQRRFDQLKEFEGNLGIEPVPPYLVSNKSN